MRLGRVREIPREHRLQHNKPFVEQPR